MSCSFWNWVWRVLSVVFCQIYVSWLVSTVVIMCHSSGAFTKLRKAKINFVLSWNNSVPPGQILMKFEIDRFFENLSRRLMFHYNRTSIKGILHEKQCNFFYHILLISSYNEKCFRQKLHRKLKHTFCIQQLFSKILPFKW